MQRESMDAPLFRDRTDAGRRLATYLTAYAGKPGVIVLALPRGGVPVAFEVAKALRAPLDVYLVRKVGIPGHEEVAMGAVASDRSYVMDPLTIESAGVSLEAFQAQLVRAYAELKRREGVYRDDLPEPELSERTIVLVDDGLATGATMHSAVTALRQRNPAEIVVAIPIAPKETCRSLEAVADRVICPYQPHHFGAVGFYYADFAQVDDDEVRRLLRDARRNKASWKVA